MRIKGGKKGADVRYWHPAIWGAMFIAHVLWVEMFGRVGTAEAVAITSYPFIITSGGEGTHMEGSAHYLSLAGDIRTKDPQGKWNLSDDEREAFRKELSERLGGALGEYDVTVSKKYKNIHVELDPKRQIR